MPVCKISDGSFAIHRWHYFMVIIACRSKFKPKLNAYSLVSSCLMLARVISYIIRCTQISVQNRIFFHPVTSCMTNTDHHDTGDRSDGRHVFHFSCYLHLALFVGDSSPVSF